MCRKLLEHPIRDFYFICGSPVLPRNFRMRVTARDEMASDSEDSGPDDDLSSVTVQGGTTDGPVAIGHIFCLPKIRLMQILGYII